MRFEFATANKIVFGNGALNELISLLPAGVMRVFVVTGGSTERARPVFELLDAARIEVQAFAVSKEPRIAFIADGVQRAQRFDAEAIIAFGGGSVIDAGKAIAALATNEGEPLDYLEVIGKGLPLVHDPLPMVAVPTTAGTGAEVTKNSVLASEDHRVKVSLRHPKMLPSVALVDPELTMTVPPDVTAYTGMDALTQVLEPYVSRMANPVTDALALAGLRRAARSLRRVYTDGDDRVAREDMAFASLMGGLALANAKLGAVHGFAGPLGGMFPDAPHGAICAALLPHVMRANVVALKERDPDNLALKRYDELGALFTGTSGADSAIAWVTETARQLAIPKLGSYGIRRDDYPAIIEKCGRSSSMKGNPIRLTDAELTRILDAAI